MHNKIKKIRIQMGLSEAQISSYLNISSYKYRRYEDGSLLLTVDVLILLSIMYDISIDLLIFDKYSVELILNEATIKELLKVSKNERAEIIEYNVCKYCTFDCISINYRVIKNILAKYLNELAKNLKILRCSQLLEISEISSVIQSDIEYYINLENGKVWPSVYDLLQLSEFFKKPINDIIGIKYEAGI